MASEPKGKATPSQKKSSQKKSSRKKPPPRSVEQRIIDATLKLAEGHDWTDLRLAEIAEEAKVSLKELTHAFSSKTGILTAFMAQIDDEVMDRVDPELAAEPARERLLDVMITRFDVLTPYKAAIAHIRNSISGDPLVLARLNRAVLLSMNKMLVAASCEAGGLPGIARAQGLAMVYREAIRVWVADDDPGMARTMAKLDHALRRGERNLRRVNMAVNLARGAADVCKAMRKRARERRQAPPAEDAVAT